jgi:glycerol-3-phosphate acyltransferase PlsY
MFDLLVDGPAGWMGRPAPDVVGQTLGVGAAGILLLSFFVGSVPTANLFARATRGVDLREVGSGTVSGTSLYRVAGFLPLAAAGLLDIGKGALGPLLAGTDRPVLAAFAGGAAVIGHNWSPFLRGAGGRGIAPALGALLVNAWPGAVLLLVGLTVGRLVHRTGVVSLVAELLLVPLLALTNGRDGALAGAAIAVPMIVKRVLGNARPLVAPGSGLRRVYLHRFLFDHDPATGTPETS